METHEYANLLPMMQAAEYSALLEDMRAGGYDETLPIVLLDGKILDGRNRYKAANELGIRPSFTDYTGDDPLGFVIRHNLNRRHLNESQRAVIASRLSNMTRSDTLKQNTDVSIDTSAKVSMERAADMMSVGRATVARVKAVERQAPELIAAIESGTISGHDASKIAKAEPMVRREAVAMVERGEVRTAEQAVKAIKIIERAERSAAIVIPNNITDRYKIYHCGVAELMDKVEPNSIDWIITDPPYPREYLRTYSDLATFANYALKEGGSLLAMAGQSYLPDIYAMLGAELTYHWTLAYTTPGGQSPQIWPRKVNTFWKPVLWYTKEDYAGRWIGDVAKSEVNDNDKNYHHWGQSESGFLSLCNKFVQRGDTVCDPFLGGGTTAVIALEIGAYFVGCDIDNNEVEKTLRRIKDGS